VEEGRAVYGNIRQTIQYLLSTNLAEILIVLGSSLASIPVPFNPISLLWINLVTDGLPSLALASEPLPENILKESNRPNPKSFFDKRFITELFIMGIIITFLGLGIYIYLLGHTDILTAKSMTFSLLVFLCLSRALSCRSETKTFFELPPNYFLISSVIVTFFLHSAVQHTELFSRIFGVRPLEYSELGILFLISLIPPTLIESYKVLTRKKA
jgi:Ca2+-transporting ATPase